jgi:hypothetical protein
MAGGYADCLSDCCGVGCDWFALIHILTNN